MYFRILGPLEVADGAAVVPIGGAKQRALLAFLLLCANEVVSSDRLIDALWGAQSPDSGRAALNVRISRLRKTLGAAAPRLLTRPPGYVLELDRDSIDLQRFEQLVGEADLALGRHGDLVAELETLVNEHPLQERLHAQLMLALYRSARQADALEVYQRIRGTLTAQLGLEPGSELRTLQTQILSHASALDVPAAPLRPAPVAQALELPPAVRVAGKGRFVGR
jgi:DNA-binding SARP family transcriptional activator